MAAFNDVFDVMISRFGSGWKGANLQVKNWIVPPEHSGKKGVVCTTAEAETADEFDNYVDEIIAQLHAIKKVARRKLNRINRQTEREGIIRKMRAGNHT